MNKTITLPPKESKFQTVVLLLLSIYIFFGYLLPHNIPYIILVLSLISMVFYIMIKKSISFSYLQLLLIIIFVIFIFDQLILASYSNFSINSMKTAIVRSAIIAIGIAFYTQGKWYKNGVKILFLFSCIHMIFSLISFFLPSIFNNIILKVLPNNLSLNISRFMSKGLYPGITDQIGRNAFYITIGISIVFSELLAFGKSKSRYIILMLLFLTLLLTGKRGHLVANFMSILFVSSVYSKINGKNIILNLLKILLSILTVFVVMINIFPESAAPIVRFIERIGGDLTSGRIFLYKKAIELFEQKPLFGWGPGVFNNMFETGTHNLYLQLLCENGMVGFTLFCSILVINLTYSLKKVKQNFSIQNKNYDYYLIFSLYIQIFYIVYGLTGNPLNDGFILLLYLIASSIQHTLKYIKSI